MRFLPDSAILGTLGHIKHAGKSRRKKGVRRSVNTRSQFVGINGDTRSFAELLEQAKQHAKEKEKAGK